MGSAEPAVRSALQKVGFDARLVDKYGAELICGSSEEDAVKDVWYRWQRDATRDGAWDGVGLADLLHLRGGIEASVAIRYAGVFGPIWDFGHTTFAHLVEMIIEYALGGSSQ